MKQRGFFTDTTICIGCKACEVACKQWNQLPDDGFHFTGMSYDNTGQLGASTWRHVAFVEEAVPPRLPFREAGNGHFAKDGNGAQAKDVTWRMLSDVCKHCVHPGCMENCPTG